MINNKKMKNKKIVLISGMVVVVGAVVMGGIFLRQPKEESRDIALLTDESMEMPTTGEAEHTVTFFNEDGLIVSQQVVKDGEAVAPVSGLQSTVIADNIGDMTSASYEAAPNAYPEYPMPELTREGTRFLGWDKELTNITSDMDVHPIAEEVVGPNMVYGDAVYVKQNDCTAYSLELGDVTEIAALQLIVTYDSQLLEYQGCQNLDSGVMTNKVDGKDEIRISYLSYENTEGSLYLGDFVFKALGPKGTQVELDIKVDMAVKVDEKEEIVNTECTASNGIIYIY